MRGLYRAVAEAWVGAQVIRKHPNLHLLVRLTHAVDAPHC